MSSLPATDVSEDALAKLNPAQREAVLHFEGPILVLAGAGSGKTRVLTTRIARLIEHHGVDPSHILAVTFTNKAAGEMRERIAKLVGEMPTGMWVGTFHAIGARMLRREAKLVGRTSSFTIYDEDDSLAAVRRIMERLKISTKRGRPRRFANAISGAKNALVSPEEYAKLAMDPLSKAASAVYDQWERTLRDANAVDFDDLLVLPVRVLQQNPDRIAAYRERFKFLLVDEYQDTNRAQYEFVKLLARRRWQRAGRRRRRSEYLRMARRGHPEHSRLRARLSNGRRGAPRGQLSLDAAGARARERRDQREHRASRQDAARDAALGRCGDARSRRSTSATRPSSWRMRSWY